jgi:uncharacterized membrane protein YfcA
MPGIEVLTPANMALLVAVMALAGVVHGALGLGFAMMATVPLALVTDVRSAILITLLPTMVVNVVSIAVAGGVREALTRFWPLALLVAGGGMLGTYWLAGVDPGPFRLLLAAVIVLYINLDRLTRIRLTWVREYPVASLAVVGLAGGVLAGTTNVMVPILIVYALESGMRRALMVPVFNLCFLAGKLAQAGTFTMLGTAGPATLLLSAPLAAAAALALLVGIRIRGRLDAETYRAWLRKTLWVVAVVLVVQFGLELR